MAVLRAPTTGHRRYGSGRARRPPPEPGGRPPGGGARRGGGLPHRREAPRRARRAVPGVRPGALGAPVEAPGGGGGRGGRGGLEPGGPDGPGPGRGGSAGHQGARALRAEARRRWECRAVLLRPELQPLRPPLPRRVLRVEAWPGLRGPLGAGGAFHRGRPGREPPSFRPRGHTEVLAALHLPMALWLAVGIGYAGGAWRSHDQRMNYVRFSGEWFIYMVLIALGGGVLMMFTIFIFNAIGMDAEWLLNRWILPCGVMGAVIIAGWLVEAKQSVIENMAPVLTLLFTPLFTLMLLAFLFT